jgi:hypothetical protein
VYPAYVKAHASLFAGGDVEAGAPVAKDVTVLTPEGENGMGDAFESACAAVLAAVRSGAGSSVPKGAAV